MEEKEILKYAGIVMIIGGLISTLSNFISNFVTWNVIASLLLIGAGVIFLIISGRK
jgi:hypothetical protein